MHHLAGDESSLGGALASPPSPFDLRGWMLDSRVTLSVVRTALCIVIPACSATGPVAEHWVRLGPDGMWVTALAQTDWGLFAGTRNNGVFLYHSETADWEPLGLSSSQVGCMLYLPGDRPKLLVGMVWRGTEPTEAAVFATEDGGETWVPSDGGLASSVGGYFWAHSLGLDPNNADRVYMGGPYSLLRSDDGGSTWEFVYGNSDQIGLGIRSISVSPHADRSVWAGGQSSLGVGPIFRSLDSGASWDVLFPAPRHEVAIEAVLVDHQRQNRVWAGLLGTVDGGSVLYSDDRGETWETSLREPLQTPALVYINETLYAVTRQFVESDLTTGRPYYRLRLFHLQDGSDSWQSIPAPESWGGWSATADENGDLIVGTMGSGVWRYSP